MPITKAVISEHICALPSVSMLTSRGYLAGTEWTCDECESVYLLTEGAASPYWKLLGVTLPELPVPDNTLPSWENAPEEASP